MLKRYTGLIGLLKETEFVLHPLSPYCPPYWIFVSTRLVSDAVWVGTPAVGAHPQPCGDVFVKFTYPEYFPGQLPVPPPLTTGIPNIVIIPPPPRSPAVIVDIVIVDEVLVFVGDVVVVLVESAFF